MTSNLEKTVQAAIETGILSGAVVHAATKVGLIYSKSFGYRSLEQGAPAVQVDDIMALASGTKLITSVAAMQIVERGLVGVDDDLGGVLPELGALKVLRKVDAGKEEEWVLEERREKITLRQLLSHSSGLAYAFLSPTIQAYNQSKGIPEFQSWETVTKSFSDPLIAQPGTIWCYSSGHEWTGYLISRLTGQSLEEYVQRNIASPLGIRDMTFFLSKNPNINPAKMVSIVRRDPSIPDGKGKVIPNTRPHFLALAKEEMGGAGLYTSMASYIKILHSLLVNDERLLKRETVDTLVFEPQLSPFAQKDLQKLFSHIAPGEEKATPPYIGTFTQVRYDHSLAGMLNLEDVDSGGLKWRRKGFLFWSGMPNIFWFIDRQAGLCGVFGTQLLPNADEETRKLIHVFEKTMYREFASQ
ncbi:transesterase (LovD), putative [Talaromyces stipitatus ATCC 10500]|uniref:Transesterase (LovD), putative n=1 Tax=Talaromyces stipitatus (strain ATCC 10500 / CBS 375.48 / QM 6759 / NRRL 1006) TaxID=441959 RepID=B8ML81_TALSN|nr:transesterase (LovD), putative [Talaromyces stipitatus ATCC 10500]EED14996.1 transesterase (LovD), putative [Talaromyces stipitatus ATCC 10500]